jgi:hypothetical protein
MFKTEGACVDYVNGPEFKHYSEPFEAMLAEAAEKTHIEYTAKYHCAVQEDKSI